MKIKSILLTLIASASFFFASAQGLSYGFKVGLNFSQLKGDLENDAAGMSLESMKNSTGFHIGAGVIYKFTDRFGVKGDFLFTQKGGKQSFDGEAVQLFYNTTGDAAVFQGNRTSFLRTTNSYLEFPITAYGRFGRFEISGGMYVGILVSSKAVGNVTFTNDQLPGGLDAEFEYSYFKDDPSEPTTWEPVDYNVVSLNGVQGLYPATVGSYYDHLNKDGNFFKGIDFGLNAGLAYFVNKGLFIGFNLNYGLIDVTNNNFDISYAELDGTTYKSRSDNDRNFTLQASVGFSF